MKKNVHVLDTSNACVDAFVSQLDNRVRKLESQRGANDNVTDEINELNERVDALDEDVTDLQITVFDLDETVTVLEETVEGLSIAVNDLDSRVSDLEDSGENGTSEPVIAFSVHNIISPIPEETNMIFPEIDANLGHGYDNETGEFTVPPGGVGVYFLFFYTLVDQGELGNFYIARNGDPLCSTYGDHDSLGSDWPSASCGVVFVLDEGTNCNEVQKILI